MALYKCGKYKLYCEILCYLDDENYATIAKVGHSEKYFGGV